MNRDISAISGNPYYPEEKRQKLNTENGMLKIEDYMYMLMQKANQTLKLFSSGDYQHALEKNFIKISGMEPPLSLKNIFILSISKTLENKELLKQNDRLLSKWKSLNYNITKQLNLPFDPTVLSDIKKINSYLSDQPYFFDDSRKFCDDIFKPIMSHIDMHNPYYSRYSKELAALAPVSKKWDSAISEMQILNGIEHVTLKAQEQSTLSLGWGHKNFLPIHAINFIIENNFKIANLAQFEGLTDQLLENLFQKNTNIKHLLIESPLITKLPQQCSQLETLHCQGSNLKSLTTCLPLLKSFDCQGSEELESLPFMPQLIDFNCYFCPKLTSLPNMPRLQIFYSEGCAFKSLPEMPQLKELSCPEYVDLESLPDMPNLTSLTCFGCDNIKNIPNLPQLTELDCNEHHLNNLPHFPKLTTLTCPFENSTSIEELLKPQLLMQLTKLDCSASNKIKSLPAHLTALTELECSYCPELESLPRLSHLKKLNRAETPKLVLQAETVPTDCVITSDGP